MILLAAIVLAFALVPVCGGRLRALTELELRRPWLLALALGIQVVLFAPGGPAWPAAHLCSYALAGAFAWENRRVPYLWVIGLGGALNLAAIAANGGTMPASARAAATAGLSGRGPANSMVLHAPHLSALGDVFAVPASLPLHNVFSVGDVVVVLGAALIAHAVGGSRLLARRVAAQ
jgi:hypothetical protein